LQKSLLCQRRQKLFLKTFPTLQKNKNTQHTARQTQQKMIRKLNIDKAYSDTMDRRPAGNTGLAKVAVQFSAETFVVEQTLVLRINICDKIATFAKLRNVGNLDEIIVPHTERLFYNQNIYPPQTF
jgi:hypothetical protein